MMRFCHTLFATQCFMKQAQLELTIIIRQLVLQIFTNNEIGDQNTSTAAVFKKYFYKITIK